MEAAGWPGQELPAGRRGREWRAGAGPGGLRGAEGTWAGRHTAGQVARKIGGWSRGVGRMPSCLLEALLDRWAGCGLAGRLPLVGVDSASISFGASKLRLTCPGCSS